MWYIKGEIGATLDETRRPLADLKIRDARVRFATLESDQFTWTARTADLDAGDSIIPDLGQKVSLYLDETRVFHGTVTDPKLTLYGATITVEGPWWWLRRAEAVSSQNDGNGDPGERPVMKFPSQDLETSLEGVIEGARLDGLPVVLSSFPSIYSLPPLQFSLTSLADVISGLLDWCPDAVAWFNHGAAIGTVQAATATTVQLNAFFSSEDDFYNGMEIEIRSGANAGESRVITDYVGSTKTATVAAWTVTPSVSDDLIVETPAAFRVTRRGLATVKTIPVAEIVRDGLEMSPVSELQVSRVVIPYATRAGDVVEWEEQASGTASPGKVWTVAVAGPELVDFLPTGALEEELTIDSTTTDLNVAMRSAIEGFTGLVADFPEGGSGWVFKTSAVVTTKTITHTWVSAGFTKSGGTWSNPTVPAGKSFIFFDEGVQPPEWAIQGYGLTRYFPSFYCYVDGNSPTSTPAYNGERSGGLDQFFLPTWVWYSNSKSDPNAVGSFEYAWLVHEIREEELAIWMIDTADIPAGGKLTRAATGAFSFLSPTSGLAGNLLAASSWLPYEGRLVLRPESITAENLLSYKFRVSGHFSALATADALPRAYDYDLASGTVTIELGAPARKDFRSLINRAVIDASASLTVL